MRDIRLTPRCSRVPCLSTATGC